MLLFSLKKIQEGPDQNVKDEHLEMLVEISVPDEIFTKILVMLDGRSLHNARQVSQDWNSFIKEQVLGTVKGRREMEKTLQQQWREANPAMREVTLNLGGLIQAYVMTLTHHFAVIASEAENSSAELANVRVIDIRDGIQLMEDFFPRRGLCTEALFSEGVLLLVWYGRGLQVLAWNVNTKKKIFDKNFSAGSCVFDQQNQQLMVERNTRLVITENAVIETVQSPLPGSGYLRAFSHPLYLTREAVGGTDTLWKINGTEVTRVELEAVDSPVICPAREALVSSSIHKLRVHDSQTGQLIKVLTPPSAIFGLQANSSQLVGWGWSRQLEEKDLRARDILLVYELKTLLSQSAGPDISPRVVEIGQPGFWVYRIYLNKTSLTVLFRNESGIFKFISFDFWNCQH